MLSLAGIGAWVFRDELVRVFAPRFLRGSDLELTRVQGLQVSSQQLSVAELDFTLGSGQLLTVKELVVGYRVVSWSETPMLESVTLSSLYLSPPPSPAPDTESGTEEGEDGLRLSAILQALREFPIPAITITELTLPQRNESFAVEIMATTGAIELHLASGELALDAMFSQADATSTATLQISLTNAGASVGNFNLSLQPMSDTYAMNGQGNLAIANLDVLLDALEQAPMSLPLQSAGLDWTIAGTVADDIRGTLDSVTNAEADAAPAFTLGMQAGSTLTLDQGIADGLGELALTFTDHAELHIATGAAPMITTATLPVQLSGSWQEDMLNVSSRITLANCQLNPDTPCNVSFDGNSSFGTYSLAGIIDVVMPGLTATTGEFSVRTQGLTLGGLPAQTPAFDVDAKLSVAEDKLSLDTPLLLRGMPADAGIRINGEYMLDSGVADMQLNMTPVQFSEGDRALSAWVKPWPYPFDVLAGSLGLEFALHWQPVPDGEGVLTGDVSASLQELAGSYGDIFFRGLNAALEADVDTSAAFSLETPPLSVTVTGVDVGLPVDSVALNFDVDRDAQRVLITSVSAELLDGTVSGMNIDYGFARERNEMTIRFDGLHLERLLELAEYDGVAAVGAVSGEIPIAISANGVEVIGGTLQADAPGGSIRYLAGAAGVQGNVGLDLVNQALGNYQFDSLTSDINYTPDGELVFAMKMQGKNPDMNNGQRINLNLNLSDNVPALLKSLQAARAIEDFLQQQYSNAQ